MEERDRRLAEFDRQHGLVNGRPPQKPVTSGTIASGIVEAVLILFLIAVVLGAIATVIWIVFV